MMKYIFNTLIFCICFFQNLNAKESEKSENIIELRRELSSKYICYEFGISNIFKIYIADGDTICDVIILDEKGEKFTTTCPKTSILKWAFDDISNDSIIAPAIADNNYNPYYYKLSVQKDNSTITLSSTISSVKYSEAIETKIEELKAFIIHLWYSNCLK